MSQYRDSPLRADGSSIRLLRMFPSDDLNAPILCEMFPSFLKDTARKPYEALSYVWGDPNQTVDITVGNCTFPVTHNLEAALRALRAAKSTTRILWIDAICINQKDDKEKGQQVAQMGDIYRNAVRTIVWLGEGDDSTDLVMTNLERVGRDALEAGVWDLDEKDLKRWPDFEPDKEKVAIRTRLERLMPRVARGYEDGVSFPLADLIDMSYRIWFKRVWVVQELSLASDYLFVCGRRLVPGDHFVAGFTFCYIWIANELRPLTRGGPLLWLPFRISRMWWRNGWPFIRTLIRVLEDKPFIPSPRAATTLGTRRKVQRPTGQSLKTQLVRAFTLISDGSLDASNPKDRIYGLLGIANDAKELAIRPDYRCNTTYQEVYAEVAKILVQHSHLDILSLCRPGYSREPPCSKVARDTKLPSWTPDWSQSIPTPWGGFLEDDLFHASGKDPLTSRSPAQSDTSPNILTIEALFVGTFDYNGASTLFAEVEGFLNRDSTRYSVDERQEAVWRIPIGNKEINALGIPQQASNRSYKEYLDMKAIVANEYKLRKVPSMASYLSTMKDMHDARPFISDSGYVGLCPDVSILGDEIYIPLGSHVPFIFRKAEGGFYQLVGEAYGHGIMYGEILKTNPPNQTLRLI